MTVRKPAHQRPPLRTHAPLNHHQIARAGMDLARERRQRSRPHAPRRTERQTRRGRTLGRRTPARKRQAAGGKPPDAPAIQQLKMGPAPDCALFSHSRGLYGRLASDPRQNECRAGRRNRHESCSSPCAHPGRSARPPDRCRNVPSAAPPACPALQAPRGGCGGRRRSSGRPESHATASNTWSSSAPAGKNRRVVERRRAVALARQYREVERLSIRQIADRLGRSPATVKAYFYDPSNANKRPTDSPRADAGLDTTRRRTAGSPGAHLPAAAPEERSFPTDLFCTWAGCPAPPVGLRF